LKKLLETLVELKPASEIGELRALFQHVLKRTYLAGDLARIEVSHLSKGQVDTQGPTVGQLIVNDEGQTRIDAA